MKKKKKPLMKFKTKYKICLHKSYFDCGLGLTNYIKYLIAFFGLASRDVNTTLVIAIIYAIFCYFLGWLWFHSDFMRANIEVGNQYNNFVKEMRSKIK